MISIKAYLLTIAIMAGLFIWREIVHDRRCNKLMDRIMARDLTEYHLDSHPPPKSGNALLRRTTAYRREGTDRE